MSGLDLGEYIHPDHDDLGPGEAPRKVLMSPDVMVQMAEAASGRHVTIDWGEPDADGFYAPVLTEHDRPTMHVRRGHRIVAREDVEDGFVDPDDPDVTIR